MSRIKLGIKAIMDKNRFMVNSDRAEITYFDDFHCFELGISGYD